MITHWTTLPFGIQLLSTLGTGVITYSIGALTSKKEPTEMMSSIFFLISAVVIPAGLFVIFHHTGFNILLSGIQNSIMAILLGIYLLSYFIFRKSILIMLSIFFGTAFFWNIAEFVRGNPYHPKDDFIEYRIMMISIAYLLLGHLF